MFKAFALDTRDSTFNITKIYGVKDDEGFVCGSYRQYILNSEAPYYVKEAGMGLVEARKIAENLNLCEENGVTPEAGLWSMQEGRAWI
jgi:hypothetical protein